MPPKPSTQTDRRPRKGDGPPKVHVARESGARLVGNEGPLKEAFVVTIPGRVAATQMTFHRPIGVTPIDKPEEQWVATPSQDVATLLARQTDPGKAGWQRSEDSRKEAIAAANIASDEESEFKESEEVLTDIRAIRRLLSSQRKAAKSAYAKMVEDDKKGKGKKYRYSGPPFQEAKAVDILDGPSFARYSAFLKALKAVPSVDYTSSFETTWGFDQKPQVPLPQYRGMRKDEVMDVMFQLLFHPAEKNSQLDEKKKATQ